MERSSTLRNSDALQAKAAEILGRIQEALAAMPGPGEIDAAVDAAIANLADRAERYTPQQVISHVAGFLQELFARLPHVGRRLSAAQARDEAALLVGPCFAAGPGEGFENAMLKLNDPSLPGMEVLYRRLGELLKERLQRSYTEWCFARHLDPADWETHCAIADLLLYRLRAGMPAEAPALRAEEFVDCIPDLFFLVQKCDPGWDPRHSAH
jgi:hypothetical protein